MAERSIVEQRICDPAFQYFHPYFYNHPYALRCELGIGDTNEEYMANARKRALEIYHLLFPKGADAIIFSHWIYDPCGCDEDEKLLYEEPINEIIDSRIAHFSRSLRFLLTYQFKYRNVVVRNLETYATPEDWFYGLDRRNRMVCYSDGIGFDFQDLIDRQLQETGEEVSFVSFANECIYSIYDDRGCDVVFMTHEKLREFYAPLQPYFLAYDAKEMARRYNEG